MSKAFIQTSDQDDKAIGIWLILVALVVFTMIMVGGATRLTQSGLSMVDWKPISGIIPPLSVEEWQAEFDAYRQYPEYKLINKGMSLDEFKSIFYWEYGHRVLGRLIGLIFFIPMMYFFIRKKVKPELKLPLIGLFILGGLQGLMGWYMVKSGLVSEPEVSHLRLTAHLTLALIIIAALCWVAWGLMRPQKLSQTAALPSGLYRLSWAIFGLIFIQLMLGALVAGLKAGFAYNTWPLMGAAFIPEGLYAFSPLWHSILDHTMTVQFNHRMVAYAVFLSVLGLVYYVHRHNMVAPIKQAAWIVFAAVCAQIIIGIFTLIYVVPVSLGVLHQGGGVLVMLSMLFFLHQCRR